MFRSTSIENLLDENPSHDVVATCGIPRLVTTGRDIISAYLQTEGETINDVKMSGRRVHILMRLPDKKESYENPPDRNPFYADTKNIVAHLNAANSWCSCV